MSALNCYVCGTAISGRYLEHHWGPFCAHHRGEVRCSACSKVIVAEGGVRLADGRAFCASCHATAVASPAEARVHQRIALRFMAKLGLRLENEISLALHDATHPSFRNENLGITRTYTRTDAHDNEIARGVEAIGVLDFMPALAFEAVVVHELYHAWEHLHRLSSSRQTSEGIAELCSWLYLDAQPKSDLRTVLQLSIEQRTDDIYGAGFRWAKQAMARHGFAGMIRRAAGTAALVTA